MEENTAEKDERDIIYQPSGDFLDVQIRLNILCHLIHCIFAINLVQTLIMIMMMTTMTMAVVVVMVMMMITKVCYLYTKRNS